MELAVILAAGLRDWVGFDIRSQVVRGQFQS